MIDASFKQGIWLATFHWKEIHNLLFPEPRKFCRVPHIQCVYFGHLDEHGRYFQLLRCLALVSYWNWVQSVKTMNYTEQAKLTMFIEQAESEHPEWKPDILSPWNRERWTYLPCSYPLLTIRETFAKIHLAPNPRFPWAERTDVYRHDKAN